MLALLGLNRIAAYIIAAVITVGACTAFYYVWKNSVEQQAMIEFNHKQLEQVVADQQRLLNQQAEIAAQSRRAQEVLQNQTRLISTRVQAVTRIIDAPASLAADRPASQILRDTILQLSREPAP